MRKILALIDQSVYAKSVCDYAAWLATGRDAQIELLHVVSPMEMSAHRIGMAGGLAVGHGPSIISNVASVTEADIEAALASGTLLVEARRAELESAVTASVTARVIVGDIVETVRNAAADADIVVIGKRGESADFANLQLGKTFERIVWGTTKPILAAPRQFRPISRWMLGFDGSAQLTQGVAALLDDGLLPNVPCDVLHVGKADGEEAAGLAALARQLEAAGIPVSVETVAGDPERIIPERVIQSEANLVALGGYKRARIWDVILGESTASALIRACQTPILLMRDPTP